MITNLKKVMLSLICQRIKRYFGFFDFRLLAEIYQFAKQKEQGKVNRIESLILKNISAFYDLAQLRPDPTVPSPTPPRPSSFLSASKRRVIRDLVRKLFGPWQRGTVLVKSKKTGKWVREVVYFAGDPEAFAWHIKIRGWLIAPEGRYRVKPQVRPLFERRDEIYIYKRRDGIFISDEFYPGYEKILISNDTLSTSAGRIKILKDKDWEIKCEDMSEKMVELLRMLEERGYIERIPSQCVKSDA